MVGSVRYPAAPQGYRVLTNMGEHGGQEVPHFHVHLFAGRPLGRMLGRPA